MYLQFHFTWDSVKALSNKKKHGISFDEAKTVFYDDNARIIHDPDHSLEEDRFILLGMSAKGRILTVSHVYRNQESYIRIISARKATKREQNRYEESLT